MKRLALLAFTARGGALAGRLAAALSRSGWQAQAFLPARLAGECPGLLPVHLPAARWVREAFSQYEALVFIGACGIAVRLVAPCLQGKQADPAVVVVDERGRFSISLVSGHIGGANRLARQLAALCGAVPVVTTATDLGGLFAVDEWAGRQGLSILSLPAAKAVAAALLAGQPVGFCSDFLVDGPLPSGLFPAEGQAVGIYIGMDGGRAPFGTTLQLMPRIVTVGVGCRRGVSAEQLMQAVDGRLADAGFVPGAVRQVATIDLKKEEPGLAALCRQRRWPLVTFTAQQLEGARGRFSSSDFVRRVTGVDNVCERAAALAGGCLVGGKRASGGVTTALAITPWQGSFAQEGGQLP